MNPIFSAAASGTRSRSVVWLVVGGMCAALTTVACGPPPAARGPEQQAVSYREFTLDPVTPGTETQDKVGVVVQAVPLRLAEVARDVRRCRFAGGGSMLDNLTSKSAHDRLEYYEVRTGRVYDAPERLIFSVKVTNRLTQVLKLDSAVVRLNAADKAVPVDTSGFSEGILVPGQQKEFQLSTDAWQAFPRDAIVHLGIYGVPTEADASGEVTKRDNFEWSFRFKVEEKTETISVPATIVQMTASQAEACN